MINDVKIPKNRGYYDNKDSKYLGTDILSKENKQHDFFKRI
jgi:hypothetical protein